MMLCDFMKQTNKQSQTLFQNFTGSVNFTVVDLLLTVNLAMTDSVIFS